MIETPSEVRIQRPCEAGQADELLGDVEASSEFHEESESLADTVFHLERQLQEFIADNLESILVNGKRLQLYSDDVSMGIEYPTSSGRRIDIRAVDDQGNFVVF